MAGHPARRFQRLAMRPVKRVHILAITVLLLTGGWLIGRDSEDARQPVGLFTSLPILWSEAPDMAGLLDPDVPPHWARTALAARGDVVALDQLNALAGSGLTRLVIAQPRPLGPDENVALDDWVKAGGKLLLLADPALTAESAFSITDRRRPQAVALLSPILARWGLRLEFDDEQALGERLVSVMDVTIPVNLPGRFQTTSGANCRSWAEGLAVSCGIGKGRVIALADAAVLEPADPDGSRRSALDWLLTAAFAAR
jgi:hypothetical protein